MKKIFIALLALTTLAACHKDDDESKKADRTVLVYMSGENTLSRYVQDDLDELITGSKSIGNNNLIVYVDRSSYKELPWLARLKDGQVTDSVSISDMGISDKDEYASDPAVMEKVIRYTIEHYPSNNNDYALAFFGHGSGWLMKDSIPYVSMARNRAYGIDNGRNSDATDDGKWLNIPSMQKVLSKFPKFSYLFFDCCYMQCLEVAYELRGVTDYIIGSPAEIPGVGAPYITVAPAMMEKTSFWKSIVDRYAEQRASGYDVPLSVVKTSEMENLAQATNIILKTCSERFNGTYPDMSDLIHYYYSTRDKQTYYDANDFFLKFAPTNEYTAWKQALDKAVIYKKMAKKWMTNIVPKYGIWSDFYGDFEMTEEKFGGVSMFVPQWRFRYRDNRDINKLGWYYAVGYKNVNWDPESPAEN